MTPIDEELEAAANRFAGLAKTMRQMKAASIEAHELDNVAALLRACKGLDKADVACDVAEQIACAPWGTLWNHGTTPTLEERAEWKGRREAALEILGFLDPDCAKSILAALEQEPRHE